VQKGSRECRAWLVVLAGKDVEVVLGKRVRSDGVDGKGRYIWEKTAAGGRG